MNRVIAKIELDNGMKFSLNEDSLPLSIGRDPACGLHIPIGHVSRRHCEIYLEKNVLCVKDTSTNGTTVGGRLLKGQTMSIQNPTPVSIADEASIKIMPCAFNEISNERRGHNDRRDDDRRNIDRRQNVVSVDFENRRADRREESRRVQQRR